MTPSNYDILKDIHEAVGRLEAKVDDRFTFTDVRIAHIEDEARDTRSKLDNLIGKAAIGLVVFMSIFGIAVTALVDWVKGLGR
jgi:hypothetical protein